LSVLHEIFETFKQNIKNTLIVNQSQQRAKAFSVNKNIDFGYETDCGINGNNFKQSGYHLNFKINKTDFELPVIGAHNMENALAAIAVAHEKGISIENCAKALENYEGIYRRMQIIGKKNGLTIIDDYAHNPVKIAAAIRACQPLTQRVIAWFQPHGFGPTRFLKNEFIDEISSVLRDSDQIWMSEIYYAGGTVSKDISANDLILGIKNKEKQGFFVENRENFPSKIKKTIKEGDIVLLMGARDPSLEKFAGFMYETLYS
jgi:UDP-N-acetylmuramate--alanine ligase